MADDINALLERASGSGSLPAPVVLNPLAATSSALQTAGSIYDLRQKQANEALGELYGQAIDKTTGRFDPLKFNALVAQTPAAAMAAKSGVESSQNLQGQQYTLSAAENAQVNAAVTAALNEKDPTKLSAAVVQQAQRLVDAGVIPRDRMMGSLLNLSNNPAELRQQLETLRVQTLPSGEATQMIYGKTGTQTGPGGVTQGIRQDVRTGAVDAPQQPGAPQGLDPGQAAARTQWLQSPRDYPDPANPTVTKHGTNETYLKDTGVPDAVIYTGGAPATPGTQPAATSPLGTGRPPATLLNPNKPQATPTAPATPTTPAPVATPTTSAPAPVSFGGYTIGGAPNALVSPATPTPATATPAPASSPAGTGISGPTPAQKAAADATVATGILGPPQFKKEVDDGVVAQNQQAILGNMLADTAQFFTGPQAGIVGKIRNLAIGIGLPGANVEAQTAKESFGKFAAQLANAQGASSDARLNVSISANPHEELSPAGVDMILRQLQGNADYVRARASLAGKYPKKEDYSGFQESIKDLDPRVFQMSRMTQPQRETYWKSLDSNAQKQIDAAGRKARELGVLGG